MTKNSTGNIIVGDYYYVDGHIWRVDGPVFGKEDTWYLSRYIQHLTLHFVKRTRIKRTGKQIRGQ